MPRSRANSSGFGHVELLVAVAITAIGIALASGLTLAGQEHIRQQERELEATHAGRVALDTILRELRLGGACLPETGEFISLEAADGGDRDELVTRYGRTTSEMSCIQTTVETAVAAAATSLPVTDPDGFSAGDYVYIRHTNGSGEYAVVATVDSANRILLIDRPVSASYPVSSGVYAIDERRFFIDDAEEPAPRLMFQISGADPQPFALGIEALDVEYELADGTVVDQPANDQEWRSLRRLHVSLTARSVLPDRNGDYYHRSQTVTIKPRNLIGS